MGRRASLSWAKMYLVEEWTLVFVCKFQQLWMLIPFIPFIVQEFVRSVFVGSAPLSPLTPSQVQDFSQGTKCFLYWCCAEPSDREHHSLVWRHHGPGSKGTVQRREGSRENHQDFSLWHHRYLHPAIHDQGQQNH